MAGLEVLVSSGVPGMDKVSLAFDGYPGGDIPDDAALVDPMFCLHRGAAIWGHDFWRSEL